MFQVVNTSLFEQWCNNHKVSAKGEKIRRTKHEPVWNNDKTIRKSQQRNRRNEEEQNMSLLKQSEILSKWVEDKKKEIIALKCIRDL
jgi:hypothetical protein